MTRHFKMTRRCLEFVKETILWLYFASKECVQGEKGISFSLYLFIFFFPLLEIAVFIDGTCAVSNLSSAVIGKWIANHFACIR